MGDRPKVVVAALVEKDGAYLLAKQVMEDGSDQWVVPGGKVEFSESLKEAAIRELKEETGFDIEITKFVDFHEAIHTKFDYHTVIFFFLAKIKSGSLVLEPELKDAQFFTREQMKEVKLVTSAKWLFERI